MAVSRHGAAARDGDDPVFPRDDFNPHVAAATAAPAPVTRRAFPWLSTKWLVIALCCVLAAANTIIGIVVASSLRAGFTQVQASYEATAALERVRSTVSIMAADHRDFLLTGQPRFLDRYHDAAQLLEEQISEAQSLTAAAGQSQRLDMVAEQVANDARAMEAVGAQPHAAPPVTVLQALNDTGQLYRTVFDMLSDTQQQERALQAARISTAEWRTDGAFDMSLLRTAVGITLIGLLLYVLRRDAVTRGILVAERSAALAAAAEALDRQLTERQAMDAVLHRQDVMLRGISNAIPQIVFVAYRNGGGEFINRRWHEYTDAAATFSKLREWERLVHPDDVARLRLRWHQAIGMSAPLIAEFRLRGKHGQYLWFLAQAVPVDEAGRGAVDRWVGTFTDIDHLHRADAAQRESEGRFRRIFEGSPFGMTLSDTSDERRILQANPAFCRMLGYAPGEIIGYSLNDLTHPDERIPGRAVAQLANVDQGWHERVKRYLTKQGGVLWARIRVALFESSTGTGPQLLAVVEDITRQRESDEALRQAQRMEAVGQLSGGLAHDFNNLLGVIIGNIECLLDTMADDPERAALAREVLDSALGGAELTRRLLAFGRRQSLSPQCIDLSMQIARHVTMLIRTLGRAIRIETVFAKGLWPTRADPSQLGDALLNLAINARDAMPHGGTLTIETYNDRIDIEGAGRGPDMTPGEYVVLAVSDTGVGMPPEVRARAMEPFFTTKGPGAGSGLGLSMIYGFVQQSGGHLTIASEVGVGTTVRICLPRVAAELDATPAEEPTPSLPTGHETILVVDDSPEMRQVAERHLRFLGYTVLTAESGPAALAMLRDGRQVDLLFTDIAMPDGLTGFQLADAARQMRPDLKVLFTTGYAGTEARTVTPDWQARVIRKPYRRPELAERVRTALC